MRVSNDILLDVDSGSPVVLLLLDLSAAFNMVDRNILIDCFKDQMGIQGIALDWFSSSEGQNHFSQFGKLFFFCCTINVWGSSGLDFRTREGWAIWKENHITFFYINITIL